MPVVAPLGHMSHLQPSSPQGWVSPVPVPRSRGVSASSLAPPQAPHVAVGRRRDTLEEYQKLLAVHQVAASFSDCQIHWRADSHQSQSCRFALVNVVFESSP